MRRKEEIENWRKALKAENEGLKAQNADLTEQLEASRSAVVAQAKLNGEHMDAIDSLKLEIDHLRIQLSDSTTKVTELEAKNLELNRANLEMDAKLKDLEAAKELAYREQLQEPVEPIGEDKSEPGDGSGYWDGNE